MNASGMKALGLCLMAATGPGFAQSQDEFPLEFFTGTYRMIGIAPEGPVDRLMRLDPSGTDLAVGLCGTDDGGRLLQPSVSGGDHYLEGRIGARTVTCDPFNTYENLPLLACHGDDGARLTLWPADDFAAPLACAP